MILQRDGTKKVQNSNVPLIGSDHVGQGVHLEREKN